MGRQTVNEQRLMNMQVRMNKIRTASFLGRDYSTALYDCIVSEAIGFTDETTTRKEFDDFVNKWHKTVSAQYERGINKMIRDAVDSTLHSYKGVRKVTSKTVDNIVAILLGVEKGSPTPPEDVLALFNSILVSIGCSDSAQIFRKKVEHKFGVLSQTTVNSLVKKAVNSTTGKKLARSKYSKVCTNEIIIHGGIYSGKEISQGGKQGRRR